MKTKDVLFIRYGGLSPLKQDHYLPDGDPDKTYHNPPRKYGTYAMIKGYEDLFLLGATNTPNHISGKMKWLKDGDKLVEDTRTYDSKSDNICTPPELKRLLKKLKIKENQLRHQRQEKIDCPKDSDCDNCPIKSECERICDLPFYLTVLKTPRIFSYTGDLWHHLTDCVDQVDIIDKSGSWIKTSYNVFIKALDKDRHNTMRDAHNADWFEKNFNDMRIHNPYKKSFGITYCKDHLEVFIEKI